MADKATLAKARKELEDLYLGVPDDSVNLTFQDLAEVKQLRHTVSSEKKRSHPLTMDPISESTPKPESKSSHLTKIPSLDFTRGLQQSADYHHHINHHATNNMYPPMSHHDHRPHRPADDQASRAHGYAHGDHGYYGHGHGGSARSHGGSVVENSKAFDDMSVMSGVSMAYSINQFGDRVGRRRPGIPHSNICTICSVYIYMFRTRCLVCGRVYCRQCVNIGMGEMTEGRKCIDCLGRRFSQRYIQKAGSVGCWASCCLNYPSEVKFQELKWAEKGPRRSSETKYVRSGNGMMSAPRSPITPRTPTMAHYSNDIPLSFIATTPPYTPTHHHMPL